MSPIYPTAQPLPRGRHSLSRSEVRSAQRTRMLEAVVELTAERSFVRVTVADIASRAGVSLRTFYEQFPDKDSCLLAAYDEGVRVLLERTGAAFRDSAGGSWRERCRAVVRTFLETLAEENAFARTFVVEIATVEAGRARRAEALLDFVRFHRTLAALARREQPDLPRRPSNRVLLALVGGVEELVADAIQRDAVGRLTEIEDDVMALIVSVQTGG